MVLLLEDVPGKDNVHLAEFGPCTDALGVLVDEIPVYVTEYGIKAYPFGHYRGLDVLLELGPSLVPLFLVVVAAVPEGVVPYGIGLGGPEEGMKVGLGDEGGVVLVLVEFREIARYPYIEVPPVDKGRGVRYDGPYVPVIELVAPELAGSELASRDDDGLQPHAVLQDEHIRVELELPAGVHHLLRDNDLEAKVHPSVPLGYVSEPRGYDRRVDHIVRHHLPGLLVADGFHEKKGLPVLSRHGDGVPGGRCDDLPLLGYFISGQGKACGEMLTMK